MCSRYLEEKRLKGQHRTKARDFSFPSKSWVCQTREGKDLEKMESKEERSLEMLISTEGKQGLISSGTRSQYLQRVVLSTVSITRVKWKAVLSLRHPPLSRRGDSYTGGNVAWQCEPCVHLAVKCCWGSERTFGMKRKGTPQKASQKRKYHIRP